MAEQYSNTQLRSYEVSIWTLQDSFVTVLKPSQLEHKGQIQNGILELGDDGLEKFSFQIPMYYYVGDTKIMNPLWTYVVEGHIVANMHKIKVILNKATEDEAVYEFLVVSVLETHEQDNISYSIECEGLAFHELGKLGYKISLSGEDFDEEYINWFKYDLGEKSEAPRQTIQYWNDKIFYHTTLLGEKRQKYDWTYEVNMDWSACSAGVARIRDPHKVYEEEIVTSWETDLVEDELFPSNVESYREKWRAVESEESNIYNLTQTIAEKFGVYCKYVYDHDENYHIIGKRVIYYNNNYQDSQKHVDITYPYNTNSIKRTVDNTELATKLFVQPIESDTSSSNLISISTVESNKSKEDYILNFDYLKKINTINQEQYDAIDEFIYKVSRLNNRIRRLDTQIRLAQTKLITAEADEAVYQSAITLDTERLNNARLLFNQLTGEDQVIAITEANPTMVMLRSANDSGSRDLKQVKLQYEGILPDTVELYTTLNLGRSAGQGRLSGLVASGNFVYDDFGNPIAITNIYIPNSDIKRLYMTCQYSPRLYYSRVSDTWQKRLDEDQVKLAEAQQRVEKYNLLLYGCDVDYAKATLSRVEYVSAGTSIADFVIGRNGRGQEIGEYGTYIGEAELEEAHGYILMREIFLLKKQILIAKFEKMMGPALREGYWTPEDYIDYGNKYNDIWHISDNTTGVWPGSVRSDLVEFVWDTTNLFEEESKISYEVGVTQDTEYYLLIDISDYLDTIKGYINTNTLSFIYYDQQMLFLNSEIAAKNRRMEELAAKSNRTESENVELQSLQLTYNTRMDAIPRNIKNALRWFTLGANCEIVYVLYKGEYKPVLMVTGLKDLLPIELKSVYSVIPGYEPYLGYVKTAVKEETDDEGVIHTNIEIDIDRLTVYGDDLSKHFLNVTTRAATYEEQYNSLLRAGYGAYLGTGRTATFYGSVVPSFWEMYTNHKEEMDALNTSPWDISTFKQTYICSDQDNQGNKILQAYPRIAVNSIDLNSNTVLLALNKRAKEQFKDFTVFVEEDLRTETEKYFITIKPAVLAAEGSGTQIIDIDYAISNAAEAIYYDALKVSKENAYPKVSYEVALNMLYPELIRTANTLLRRVVYINDVDLLLDDVAGYISTVRLNLDHPWEDEVEVKNYETKFEDLFSTIVAETEAMKKSEVAINYAALAFSGSGIINSHVLQESMLKADLNYSFNQGTLTIDEKNGIWAVSDAGVVAFRGGGIFTASEKDTNGAWKWNTGILPTGINADLITTGQLDTNKIYIYAGDKIRFQMNGEGLFAYKALFEDQIVVDNDNVQQYINSKTDDIDASQYITYNENGIYLVARKNALVLNKEKNDYIRVGYKADKVTPIASFPTELNRVEISWNGLKLRNWNNEEVFSADPDTGNLTLTGTIYTRSGEIGGWSIGANSLTSKNVSFFSSNDSTEFSGIRLSAKESQTLIQNDTTYYAYKIKDSNDSTVYYNSARPTDGIDTLILTSRNNDCLYYATVIQGVKPLLTITDPQTSAIYVADPFTGQAIILNGQRIVYSSSTSTSSTWYVQLQSYLQAQNKDINDYVEYWYGSDLTDIELPAGTELVLDSDTPSFVANAVTGEVRIAKGILGDDKSGGFILKSNGLYNGSLYSVRINSDSRIVYGSASYGLDSYQNCFNGFYTNSDSSEFTLVRVNGGVENFNIANSKFFKTQMLAAVVIHNKENGLSLSGSEKTSAVNVNVWTSGYGGVGDSFNDSYPVGDVWQDGWNKGDRNGYTRGHDGVSITELSMTGHRYSGGWQYVDLYCKASNGATSSTTFAFKPHGAFNAGVEAAKGEVISYFDQGNIKSFAKWQLASL